VHVPAQVKLAVRLGLPTLVVIRAPADAVASLVLAAPHVPVRHGLREFAHHYEELLPVRDQVVVADFEVVTKDFGAVVEAMNSRFATSFIPFQHTREAETRVFERMKDRNDRAHKGDTRSRYDTRPSATRTAGRPELVERISAPAMRDDLNRAIRVYDRFRSRAAT